jgi:tRNA1Val (adenine37-N6)-methyltransferase
MSNQWFRFQKFLIRQDRSAMKVGTDGVLLGAWAGCDHCSTILDIGTGTGLIALMLAQRNSDTMITALEIDSSASTQARENVSESFWKDRITVIEDDFCSWEPAHGLGFDLIVSNPPFFTRSLKNPDNQRATARHDDELPFSCLISKAAGLLTSLGKLSLVLPTDRVSEVTRMTSEAGLFLHRRMDVRGHGQAPVKRVLLEWGRGERSLEITELIIEKEVRGEFTEEYKRLTGEFYL